MSRPADINRLKEIASRIDATYADGIGINPVEGDNLPRRAEVIEVTEKLLELVFPGFDRHAGTPNIVALLAEIRSELSGQICRAIRHEDDTPQECGSSCRIRHCERAVFAMLEALPEIRAIPAGAREQSGIGW